MPFSLEFLLFGSVCSLVLYYFAGDAFVAGDIDQIDAGGKGTHTEMGVGTADHLAGRVIDGYFLVLGVDDFSAVERDRTAVSGDDGSCGWCAAGVGEVHGFERGIAFGSHDRVPFGGNLNSSNRVCAAGHDLHFVARRVTGDELPPLRERFASLLLFLFRVLSIRCRKRAKVKSQAQKNPTYASFCGIFLLFISCFNDLYGRDIQADGKPLLHTRKVFVG